MARRAFRQSVIVGFDFANFCPPQSRDLRQTSPGERAPRLSRISRRSRTASASVIRVTNDALEFRELICSA